MAATSEDMESHKKAYTAVGIALGVLTCVTLLLGVWHPLDFGYPGLDWRDVVAGLLVALVKASLVALIFMHLNHERGLVYKVLLFTFCFFLSLMVLTLFAWADPIREAFDAVRSSLS